MPEDSFIVSVASRISIIHPQPAASRWVTFKGFKTHPRLNSAFDLRCGSLFFAAEQHFKGKSGNQGMRSP
jgi:hypothetical protein